MSARNTLYPSQHTVRLTRGYFITLMTILCLRSRPLDLVMTSKELLISGTPMLESLAASLKPNVIDITETWFDSELNGYKLFRTDRKGDKRGSCVCIYVNSCVKAFAASNEPFLGTDCEQI